MSAVPPATQAPIVTVTIDITAPIDQVWAAVSSPEGYGRFSPEATGARRLSGAGEWAVGDRFVGLNKLWVPWRTQCRVVSCIPHQEFAFESNIGPLPIARWSYSLSESAPGTVTVTEQWTDRRRGLAATLAAPSGLVVGRGRDAAQHNRASMERTLRQLKAVLESV